MKLPLLQTRLQKEKIAYLLLSHTDPNFTYFTGLKGLSFSLLALPQKGKPLLFVTSLDKEKISHQAKSILISKPWEKSLPQYLHPKTLAFNFQNLTLYQHRKFKKIFPRITFKDFSRPLQQLRAEKTPQEILYLKKAARFTAQAFSQIISLLKKKRFQTENDLKLFLYQFALRHSLEFSFPPIIASGKNTKNPHHQTSNQKLQRGFLLLDFGFSYQNYCSDMTRMLYLGRPKKTELALYSFLLKIQSQALQSLRPHQKAHQIDRQVRKALAPYSSYFTHSLGHGVGIEIHESPSLKPESKDQIKPTYVFTLEPGLYFKNFGLRIEDTLLMQEKPVRLTQAPKELVVIK